MSLNRREVLFLRTGRPGAGKSWSLVRYLVDEWLPDHPGRVFTNLPLQIEAIAEYVGRGDREKAQRTLDRLFIIPTEE